MYILGIETSCDETAASVVKDGRYILSNIVASSLKEHAKYGGIIPEIASRRQLELINQVVSESLNKANLNLDQISAIAVTKSPGLIGSVLVGLSFARGLSCALKKELIEVNHIKAHLYANFIDNVSLKEKSKNSNFSLPKLPAIGLIVSGGHTNFYYMKNHSDYQLLGNTLDDAAGEAYDKVARILGLGYPGGPVIDKLARNGFNKQISFPCAELKNTLNFSFSGIKTSVLYYKQKFSNLDKDHISKIVYSFQKSVVSILVKKCIQACLEKKVKTLVIGGGVAANSSLREELALATKRNGIKLYIPPVALCVDNAAMIAGIGYHMLRSR